jgi:hypothetical protein
MYTLVTVKLSLLYANPKLHDTSLPPRSVGHCHPLSKQLKCCGLDGLFLVLSTDEPVLLLLNDFANGCSCHVFIMGIEDSLNLMVKTKITLLSLRGVRSVFAEKHFDLFNGLTTSLKTMLVRNCQLAYILPSG